MSKSLKLGDALSLPLTSVTEKIAFLGRTGSGKTYAAMKLAELMLDAGAQIGAIDPVGVWRALRVPAVKGGTSYEVVVFGGLYGDLPLAPTAGELVADLICDRGISFVLDVSQWIPAEQHRFVHAFADRFFHRKKSAPSAVHLFMEECQEFIPENPSGKLEQLTLGVMQRLWKLGRNFGIGGSLISQRPQEIAKKALNMSGTMFAFQMTGPQERKAVKSWVADLGVSVDIESVLQKLNIGEPHVESPMFLKVSKTVRILARGTADLSSTPEVGASIAAKRALTPIDVAQLQAAMAETIERAKADDPKELKKLLAQASKDAAASARRISELEARVSRSSGSSLSNETAKKEQPVLTDADRDALKSLRDDFTTFSEDISAKADAMLTGLADRAKATIDAALLAWTGEVDKRRALWILQLEKTRIQRILEKLERVTLAENSPNVARPLPAPRISQDRPDFARTENNPNKTGGAARKQNLAPSEGLTGAEQRILDAVGWWRAARIEAPSRHQVAFVARYTVNGHFNNLVGGLRTKGLVDYPPGGGVFLTDAGTHAAALPQDTPTFQELIDRVLLVLAPPQGRLFRAVVDAGRDLSREELAGLTHYTVNGHFNNMVGSLRSLGVIQYPLGGGVRLGDMFEALL